MAGNAFTAGVKPGGLTTSTEIRILLCYLLAQAGTPLSRQEIETALLGEELVNYFELANSLSELCEQGFLSEREGRYAVLPEGEEIARTTSRAACASPPFGPRWRRASSPTGRRSTTPRLSPRRGRVILSDAACAIWRATYFPLRYMCRTV